MKKATWITKLERAITLENKKLILLWLPVTIFYIWYITPALVELFGYFSQTGTEWMRHVPAVYLIPVLIIAFFSIIGIRSLDMALRKDIPANENDDHIYRFLLFFVLNFFPSGFIVFLLAMIVLAAQSVATYLPGWGNMFL